MIKELLLYFALLLWFVVPLSAQPTIFVEDFHADKGSIVEMPVKIKNFTEIQGMQFSLSWDSSILRFKEFGQFPLPGLYAQNFGPSEIVDYVAATWWPIELTHTAEDGDIAFTMIFEVIGQESEKSELAFPGSPVSNLIITNNEEIPLEIQEAMFTVGEPVSTTGLNKYLTQVSNTPNPFKEYTNIQFYLNENIDELTFTIYDATGRELHTSTKDYNTGTNELKVVKEMLPYHGIYFYRLQSATFDFTDKMIFNN